MAKSKTKTFVWCVFSEQYAEYEDGFGTHVNKDVKVRRLLEIFSNEDAAHDYITAQPYRFFNYRLPNPESAIIEKREVLTSYD